MQRPVRDQDASGIEAGTSVRAPVLASHLRENYPYGRDIALGEAANTTSSSQIARWDFGDTIKPCYRWFVQTYSLPLAYWVVVFKGQLVSDACYHGDKRTVSSRRQDDDGSKFIAMALREIETGVPDLPRPRDLLTHRRRPIPPAAPRHHLHSAAPCMPMQRWRQMMAPQAVSHTAVPRPRSTSRGMY